MYKSTRSKKLYTSSEAILNGLADDGGLFVPESFNNIGFNENWLKLNYKETAFKILKHFFASIFCEMLSEISHFFPLENTTYSEKANRSHWIFRKFIEKWFAEYQE